MNLKKVGTGNTPQRPRQPRSFTQRRQLVQVKQVVQGRPVAQRRRPVQERPTAKGRATEKPQFQQQRIFVRREAAGRPTEIDFEKVRQEWQKRLEESAGTSLEGKTIFCAFNVVVDYQEFVKAEHVEKLAKESGRENEVWQRSQGEPTEINSQFDFLVALVHGLRFGKSMHIVSESQELFQWFEQEFRGPDKQRMGGQAGIIANQAAVLGANATLYSPIFSQRQAGLVEPGVKFPVIRGRRMVLLPARQAARRGDATKINWIFEYEKGQRLKIAGNEIVVPRANRLIVASQMKIAPAFEDELRPFVPEMARAAGVAIIAGLHYLKPSYDDGRTARDYLEQLCQDLKELKKYNRELVVHYEYVPVQHKELEKDIMTCLAGAVDSVGINEEEIRELLKMLGFEREAAEIERDENAWTLFQGARKVFEQLKLKRLHLHNLGYHLLLLKKPYYAELERVRGAVLYSSVAATSKAILGRQIAAEELHVSLKTPLSNIGFEQTRLLAEKTGGIDRKKLFEEGTWDCGEFHVLLVPGQVADRAASTVGLGDVVSFCSLLAEAPERKRGTEEERRGPRRRTGRGQEKRGYAKRQPLQRPPGKFGPTKPAGQAKPFSHRREARERKPVQDKKGAPGNRRPNREMAAQPKPALYSSRQRTPETPKPRRHFSGKRTVPSRPRH